MSSVKKMGIKQHTAVQLVEDSHRKFTVKEELELSL
jgi:hypothetical protein